MTRFTVVASALALLGLLLVTDNASAQTTAKGAGKGAQAVHQFDADGDGIINCLDSDYTRPQDGTGRKLGKMNGGKGMGAGQGKRGAGVCDGTGPGSGTGVCDGSGPKGKGR